MRTRKRDQVLVKFSCQEQRFIYLFVEMKTINHHTYQRQKLTHTYWTFLKFTSVLKGLQSVSNRLYMCNKSTSTCIKMTWIKQLCIKTTVNHAPYMSFLLVSVISITRLLTIYQLKNQPIFQLSFLINISSLCLTLFFSSYNRCRAYLL